MKKLMVLVAAIAMMASSAYAAEWNFYGSARVQSWWTDTETIDSGISSVNNLTYALQGNSRIGARVKVSDELSGRFEYGSGPNLRLLYGEWNFGAGSFLVGQDYGPLVIGYSNQAFDGDTNMLWYGSVYTGRQAQLKLKFGDFQIAAVAPTTTTDTTLGVTATRTELTLPAFEARYTFNMENVSFRVAAGYQTFEAINGTVTRDVNSYVIGAGVKGTFGGFYAAGTAWGGENTGNLLVTETKGVTGAAAGGEGLAVLTATGIQDNEGMGYSILAGYTVNDMFSFEAGYGKVETELDNVANSDDNTQTYYINATITLAPGVFIMPEYGVIDGEEAGELEVTYFGAKWQINF